MAQTINENESKTQAAAQAAAQAATAVEAGEEHSQVGRDRECRRDGEVGLESVARDEAVLPSSRLSGRWIVRLACGLLLIVVLMWRHEQAAQGWQSLARAWKLVPWPVLPLAVAWYWAGQVISALKWRLLLRARGIAVSLRECCRWYAVGMFWNLWMPTNIGGDAVRVFLAAPRCGGRFLSAASVLVERLTGFVALLAIGAVALIVDAAHPSAAGRAANATTHVSASGVSASGVSASGAYSGQAARLFLAAFGVLLGLFLLWLSLGFVTRHLEARAPANIVARRLAAARRALESYGRREMRSTLAGALLLSLLFQASQIVLNIALARVVGLEVRSEVFWWLVPLLALASLLPVGIGGLGVREAAAAALLANSGAALPTIVLWSLLWQATVWIASLPGLFWRSSARRDHAVANHAAP